MALPVVEAHCHYRQPARYDELLDVDTQVLDLRVASLRFLYQIRRDNTLLAEGFTRHACIDNAGRPQRFPAPFIDIVKAIPGKGTDPID
jgi:acyl-CoA thioester hydrolase